MEWVYLSPHYDDVAFSCGGLVWEQVQQGNRVSILTICAGKPPPGPISEFAQGLHARWGATPDPIEVRRTENIQSCRILGATPVDFSIPDAIYRRSPVDQSPLYTSETDLFSGVPVEEFSLVERLKDELTQALPGTCELVCPLALGDHVDHNLVRTTAETLQRPLWYFGDFPYLLDWHAATPDPRSQMSGRRFSITERGLEAWQASIAAHQSQISTFWDGVGEMNEAVRAFWEADQGLKLYKSR
jgi:LmbE family N-acetylglucosaminyl deacetylase